MMSLQVVSKDSLLLNEIADFLLSENLVANALLSQESTYKVKKGDTVLSEKVFLLKCISKSLLFGRINEALRHRYGEHTPLVYSEPIIMVDPEQRDILLQSLTKV